MNYSTVNHNLGFLSRYKLPKIYNFLHPVSRKRKQKELIRIRYLESSGSPIIGIRIEVVANAPKNEPNKSKP